METDVFAKEKEIEIEFKAIKDPHIEGPEFTGDHHETDLEVIEPSEGAKEDVREKPFTGAFAMSGFGSREPGGLFGGRFGSRRNLRASGGGAQTESAVWRGLTWLKKHQNPDGMWSCKHFMGNCRTGACTGAGSKDEYDVGVTGLALLAFLGTGQTHKHGKNKSIVRKALKALMDRQGPDGCFGPREGDGHWIYNHAICTLAFAETQNLSYWSPLLHRPTQKAVDFLVECRNPLHGWGYGRRTGKSDTSVTGWAVMALKIAQAGRIKVPSEVLDDALNWFDRVTDEECGRVAYTPVGPSLERPHRFPPDEAMTAQALFSRVLLLGREADTRREVLLGGRLLQESLPRWDLEKGSIDYYYWHFGTLAMFQLEPSSWRVWNDRLKSALVPTQRSSGCEIGSWDPVGAWGNAGGRVYSTAINTLTLETYYRYRRFPEKK